MSQSDEIRRNHHTRISRDPEILGGRPVVTGTRIPVSLILNLIGHGYSTERVTQAYPNLTVEDVHAALLYAEQQIDSLETGDLVATR